MEEQEFRYRGWLRVLLLFIPIFIITGLFQIFGALILGVDYTSLEKRTSLESLIINFSGLLGTFFALWIFMRFVDKEPFIKLGFQVKNRYKEFAVGLVIGLIIMSLGYGVLIYLKEITFLKANFNLTELIILVLIFIIVAVGEEVILRGYILKNLLFSFNKYVALIVSSVLFSLIHGFNDHVDLFALLNLFLAGILLGLPYIYTKNLWFSIALHLSWNLFQALFGFNVSGHENYSIIEFKMTNQPNLLNGGAFGFEGSYLAIIAQIITIVIIAYYYNRKKEL